MAGARGQGGGPPGLAGSVEGSPRMQRMWWEMLKSRRQRSGPVMLFENVWVLVPKFPMLGGRFSIQQAPSNSWDNNWMSRNSTSL